CARSVVTTVPRGYFDVW
nr:immunoglobulin heavy chain junction region [Mus musculus]NSM03783.1 immunoglobulin heavy chain junction region [Mus musculus]NSM03918.1 immunoglobulin heavy chain junction region [Mus musculus]NSM03952.1 immunoglobulin heavy chain junction region [Mus musculus]NSM04285.1 immunoglobulin heavy chain junction region [Mus musculus]